MRIKKEYALAHIKISNQFFFGTKMSNKTTKGLIYFLEEDFT
jgi:hypothetical protein